MSAQEISPTGTSASRYDTVVDLASENDSHTLMVRLVGSGKRVLDVGCASGYLARVLVANGCTVSGVEYDAAAAEEARDTLDRLVVGDLEQLDLAAELGTGQFDVVVLGDVLEHLRDPLPVLRQVRPLLAPGGYVVISIPNVAHAAVRIRLLQGRFEYRELGLLDSTHLRFFTRESLSALLHDAGLGATDFLRTTADVFATEQQVRPDEVPPEVLAMVMADPDATTYQFVVRAVPDDGDFLVDRMRTRLEAELGALEERAALAEAEVARLSHALDEARPALAGAVERDAAHVEMAAELVRVTARAEAAEARYAEVMQTRIMRTAGPLRAVYGRFRTP